MDLGVLDAANDVILTELVSVPDVLSPEVALPDVTPSCVDMDHDGHRSGACGGDDCDDNDQMRYPGRAEICDAMGHDEDCDVCTVAAPTGGNGDTDGDGFVSIRCTNRFTGTAPSTCDPLSTRVDAARMVVAGADCDDTDRNVRPNQTEACNGRDDNCNGMIDEGAVRTVYPDNDGDGFGARDVPARMVMGCALPTGFSETNSDCDDTNRMINPAATELCDGVDNNCDGLTDNGGVGGTFYRDQDGDGRGDPAVSMTRTDCAAPMGYVPRAGDCNDRDATVYIGAVELCDAIDNDCSQSGVSAGGVDRSEDLDGDRHSPLGAMCAGGYPRDDCNDALATIYLGAIESCNGIDDNCDRVVDEEPMASASCGRLFAHGIGTCGRGVCNIAHCNVGFDDCDHVAANGCEAELASVANCGTCGTICGLGLECRAGNCLSTADIVQLEAGGAHTCARRSSGAVLCWGDNTYGQLGDGSSGRRPFRPVTVSGLTDAVEIAAGVQHTCARRSSGTVVCWGRNFEGELGDGTRTESSSDRPTPVPVVGLNDAVRISVGNAHSCARRISGAVVCWGYNGVGQLGDGTMTRRLSPVAVTGLNDAVEISVGETHACALRLSGVVVCWGNNNSGQLGDGTIVNRATPVAVTGLGAAIEISAGVSHTCVRVASGLAFCWGNNPVGQLGDGTTTQRLTPVAVSYLPDVVEISAGGAHTCARRVGGAALCWGNNFNGSLGDGTTVNRLTPVSVLGLPAILGISAGRIHSCAMRTIGGVFCWGANHGGLEDGTRAISLVPTAVLNP